MSLTRRDFLKTAAAGGAAGAAALTAGRVLADFTPTKGKRRLRLLILGGTAFLGPATIEVARARGHEITIFNRGRTNEYLFPDLPKLQGDRFDDLVALETGEWDVCIDNSGYIPRTVAASAGLLRDRVKQYIFVSSISVFKDFTIKGLNENSAVGTLTAEEIAAARSMSDITGANYGPLKALCEQENTRIFGRRACNIRPGLIVGPMDRSDRFTYWPVRVSQGGEVLAPGTPETITQVIDVRDLAEFIVHAAEQGLDGTFNCTSPSGELTMGELLDTCRRVSASDATFTWADAAFLEEQEVAAWSDMPVWVPLDGDEAGHPYIDVSRALAAGLTFRPISETVRGTLDWWATEPQERRDKPMRSGLTPEREAEVLAAWHARKG
jgi:2'-hydroxyisoflavone reductase